MSGLFISFEGGDGAGKSTQAARLAHALRERGYEVLTTREPGGTELGQQIRDLLLHGVNLKSAQAPTEKNEAPDSTCAAQSPDITTDSEHDIAPRAEALLFAADRAHHVYAKIRPALERGAIVISDRYMDSSVAYQGGARALDPAHIRDISLWAADGLLPDVTVLLDVPVNQGFDRVGTEHDRMESQGESFHERVRDKFLQLAADEPDRFIVIDGRLPISDIAQQVWAAVEPLLAKPPAPEPPAPEPLAPEAVADEPPALKPLPLEPQL